MVRPSFVKELNDQEMNIKDYAKEFICYNKLAVFFRKVGRFILRIIRWFPVLWAQEEWDFGYTYDILEHKIKEIRKCVEKDTWHTEECVQESLEQIDSVLDHLDKFRNYENYVELPEFSAEKCIKNENDTYSMNFSKEEHEMFEEADKFEEEHYNAFWDELKKYSSNWWT